MNRNSKDSVFCDLFSDPKYVFELYKALHPEDKDTDITEIKMVTFENHLLRAQYNDLGFIIGNRLLILVEEPSYWSLNVLIRILLYLADTYQRYIRNSNLNVYGTKKIDLPKPEFYVVYPKERIDKPEEISLAKEFFGIEDPKDSFVDIRVKMIYDSEQGDILNQYIIFCRVFDEQVKIHGKTEKTVRETIRICRDRDVLKDYLAKEEVANIMFLLFDEEYHSEIIGYA